MQGEINGLVRSIKNETEIYAMSNIDAVHYSTKLEGNKLTLKQVTKALSGDIKSIKLYRDLKEVINYAKARKFIFDRVDSTRELSLPLIL